MFTEKLPTAALAFVNQDSHKDNVSLFLIQSERISLVICVTFLIVNKRYWRHGFF